MPRHRFDRIRVDLGDGLDALAFSGGPGANHFDVTAAGDRVRLLRNQLETELDNVDILRLAGQDGTDTLNVGDLSATDTFQVDADLGAGADKAIVNGSEDDDQISFGSFGLLGPTFVRFLTPRPRIA